MSDTESKAPDEGDASGEGEPAAAPAEQAPFLVEFGQFLFENKKWWLIPIIVTTLLLAALLMYAKPASAPFTYSLF